MDAPFDRKYLDKLKSFVDFASQNPLILNMPELSFVKRFIEQFGGKVPDDKYQITKVGQCSFQNTVKYESRVQVVNNDKVNYEEVGVSNLLLEEASATNAEFNTVTSTENVIYLEETPYKRCSFQKTKTTHRKIKTRINARTIKKCKKDFVKEHSKSHIRYDDPLCMDNDKVLKSEPLEQEPKSFKDSDEYENNNANNSNDDDYEEKLATNSEDDEPLIMIIRRRGRPSKYTKNDWADDIKVKSPRPVTCREMCKQKCVEKFTEDERKEMCNHFWSLSVHERISYIRTHSKAKRFTRLKRKREKKRGNNCVYFLHNPNKGNIGAIRICRSYFEATLCLTHYNIKKALDGYEPEPEERGLIKQFCPIIYEEGKKRQKNQDESKRKDENVKTTEIEQILDPVTGQLTIIHHNFNQNNKEVSANKNITTPTNACGKVKQKRIRKKPNQPVERFPKRIKCAEHCKYKCHMKFTEDQRQQICSTFWSMDYKRRKDFILSRVETRAVETETTPEFRKSNRPPRTYHTRFYLRAGLNADNIRVCKDFLMATLCISRHFITNALEFADQNTGYYIGGDRRGHHTPGNKISEQRIQEIRQHIQSYPTWMPNKKSKTRYLHSSLNIKRLYNEYKEKCIAENKKYVSNNFFYGIFHNDFKLAFLKPISPNTIPKSKFAKDEKKFWNKGLMNLNPNISTYTGEEPGGFWCSSNGDTGPIDSTVQNVTRPTSTYEMSPDTPNDLTNNTSMEDSRVRRNSTTTSTPFGEHLSYPANYFSNSYTTAITNATNRNNILNSAIFTRPDVLNPAIFEASTTFKIL